MVEQRSPKPSVRVRLLHPLPTKKDRHRKGLRCFCFMHCMYNFEFGDYWGTKDIKRYLKLGHVYDKRP